MYCCISISLEQGLEEILQASSHRLSVEPEMSLRDLAAGLLVCVKAVTAKS
jgi:hypothetical protein